jgi:hypothetical protein
MRISKQICICSEKDIRDSGNEAYYESTEFKDLSSRAKLMTMFSKSKKDNPKDDFFETSDPDFYLVSPERRSNNRNTSSILKDKESHRVTPPGNSRIVNISAIKYGD